ncbi:MAG: hypothetical protein J1E60_07850 [Christensenellaceae bacterium]|nr:hypothetical protein [Christensenellaceae bacterium]
MDSTILKNGDNNLHFVVSTVAYLLGVPKRIFENEYEPPKLDIYEELDKDKRARIIRNLCMLRTAVERNFNQINQQMRYAFKNLNTIPELVPVECIDSLIEDGVSVVKSNTKLNKYIIEFNKLISDRINNCKELFPIWLNWSYIRDLFIMPDGMTEKGVRNAANVYFTNRSRYPYQVYMNWRAADDGNILHNDRKFITLLYGRHGEKFTDISKVSDVRTSTKNNIYDFLEASTRTVLVVDCENSNPYKLCATLNGLDNNFLNKIVKIILYDDVHSSSAWGMLSSYTDIPVKHIINERIKQNKSLVDINLTAGVCKEFYRYDVDSFIIVSSDSDYWGLISSIPEANFLVMVEHEKCGPDIKSTLKDWDIFYCYIDDFYSGDTHGIMIAALIKEVRKYIDARIQLNVNEMMEEAYRTTRITMTESEKKQFFEKYIRPMHLRIESDGSVTIQLNK